MMSLINGPRISYENFLACSIYSIPYFLVYSSLSNILNNFTIQLPEWNIILVWGQRIVSKSNGTLNFRKNTTTKNLSKIMCFRTFQITLLRYLGFSKTYGDILRGLGMKKRLLGKDVCTLLLPKHVHMPALSRDSLYLCFYNNLQ